MQLAPWRLDLEAMEKIRANFVLSPNWKRTAEWWSSTYGIRALMLRNMQQGSAILAASVGTRGTI
jgi:hypothetical protein